MTYGCAWLRACVQRSRFFAVHVPTAPSPRRRGIPVSAIAGVFHLDGSPASPDAIVGMLGVMAHRGADVSGVWSEGPIALAHGCWATTPAPVYGGKPQPAVRQRSGLLLVADARIDNRNELAATLDMDRASTDVELILSAYERWGFACAEKLIGDFALAIWDSRERSLFCARDVMGVKPFYYFQTGRIFAFASEIKALFALPGVPRDLDQEQVALYLGWSQDDRASTLYKQISRLPAAHHMVVRSSGRASRSEYWRLDCTREVRYASDDQYVEAFRECFGEAVRARLSTDQRIGATLSGGLDSSSIVCEARRRLTNQGSRGPELHTFSLVFPDVPDDDLKLIDERAFAERVTSGGGLHAHFVRGDRLSPLGDVRRMLWHVDEPFFAPNLYLHWGLYGAARASGIRVLLDGFDGDSVVSHGLGRLNSLARARRWDAFETEVRAFAGHRRMDPTTVLPHFGLPYLSELARHGRAIAWLDAARQLGRRFGVSRRQLAVEHGLLAVMPRMVATLWRGVRVGPEAESSVLRGPVSRRIARAERAARRAEARPVTERELHRHGLAQPAYQLTLEIADKAAAAFGIEPRYPFFDRRLIEFCLGLPEEQKFGGGWPRLLFRRAMEGVLPPEIQWRATKANLSSNFHRRFLEADQARVDGMDFRAIASYVDVDALGRALRRYRSEWKRGDSDAEGCLLFRTSVLTAWLSESWSVSEAKATARNPQAPVAA